MNPVEYALSSERKIVIAMFTFNASPWNISLSGEPGLIIPRTLIYLRTTLTSDLDVAKMNNRPCRIQRLGVFES